MSPILKLLDNARKNALDKPDTSLTYATQALELAKETSDPTSEAKALYYMAYACRVKSDYASGLAYAFQSLELFKMNRSPEGMLKAINIIGIIYFYFGAYSEALSYFIKALELIEDIDNPNMESSVYNNIGEIYRMAESYTQAIDYYEKAVLVCEKHEEWHNKAVILLNIGEIHFRKSNYSDAIKAVQTAYEILINSGDPISRGEAETKLGKIYMREGDFEKAETYFTLAYTNLTRINNEFYLVELLIEMASFDEIRDASPLKNLHEALNISIENNFGNKISQIYKALSEFYESEKDFDKALTYYKGYHVKEKENEASNLAKRLEILSLELKYNQMETLAEKLAQDVVDTQKELKALESHNATLMQEVLIDELTRLLNRRGLNRKFSTLFSANTTLNGTVFIIDIDHFKTFNDAYGHLKGDDCLRQLSRILELSLPETAFVGRYGGEEFLCFIPNSDLSKAEAIKTGDHIRKNVIEKMPYTITVSIGLYVGQITHETLDQAIHLADMALYEAKENGRNQVKLSS